MGSRLEPVSLLFPPASDPEFTVRCLAPAAALIKSGANSFVNAAVADGAGNVYIGGNFTGVRDVGANYVAKWNGSEWSDLGGGLDWEV